MKKLTIAGLGLMGGSLGLAVKHRKLAETVCGYARRSETRAEALKLGAVDTVSDNISEAVKDADMVVFCTPVLTIPKLAAECMGSLSPDCIVTDVGSTKAELVAEMTKLLKINKIQFVGSHPIAGSDETSISASRINLYDGATTVVTPAQSTLNQALARTISFWESLDSKVIVLSPQEHDDLIARTSHLPHLVAAMLVSTVFRNNNEDTVKMCGTGFRDSTRIAGGSEEIWHDIIKSNRVPVAKELEELGKVLESVRSLLEKNDFDGIKRFLARSREIRREFSK